MKLRWLAAVGAALILTLGGPSAFAQDKVTQDKTGEAIHAKMEAMHQHLQKVLDVIDATPAQANKIMEILQQGMHEKIQLKLAGGPKADLVARTDAVQERTVKAVTGLLSPAQIQKLNAIGGISALMGEEGHSIWNLLDGMNLSVEQKVQMKEIMARAEASMRALKQDQTLSADQVKVKMAALHESAMTQVHAILTPVQRQRLQQLMEEHLKGRKIVP